MRISDWSSDVCSSDLEWWHYGYRIRPGDQLFQERRFHDYKVADTKFAGPTVFQRGDTLHRNQHGTPVAKSRSTAIRYLAAEAEKRKMYARSEEHTSELQSLMRISYAVFCLKKKKEA